MKMYFSSGFFYNDTTHDCVVNIKLLLQTLTAKYDTQGNPTLHKLALVFRKKKLYE